MDVRAGPSNGAAVSSAAGAPASELPSKRRRLDSPGPSQQTAPTSPRWAHDKVFVDCLKDQVFPHVDHAIAQLPTYRVNTNAIAKKVVEILTGPTTGFGKEYKRGNGRITPAFELHLSQLAFQEARAFAKRPEYQLPSVKQTPIPPPRLPGFPPLSYAVGRKQPAAPPTPRVSTSPIPIPAIPGRLPNGNSALRNYTTAGQASQPIVIDDDEEEEEDVGKVDLGPEAARKVAALPHIKRNPSVDGSSPPPYRVHAVQQLTPRRDSVERTKPSTVNKPLSLAQIVRPRASTWDASEDEAARTQTAPSWFSNHHPYLSGEERYLTLNGAGRVVQRDNSIPTTPVVVHVDFTSDELQHLRNIVRDVLHDVGSVRKGPSKNAAKDLRRLWRENKAHHARILHRLQGSMPRREKQDLLNFFGDLARRQTAQEPALLTVGTDENGQQRKFARETRVHSLLFRREVSGYRGYRSMRRLVNFHNEFKIYREDDLELRAEWTDCAGDINTIVWTSNNTFICGTTEHSDSHNQQYNKPGNLVLGSCKTGRVQAYPEHRIVRPIVEKGDNAAEAMRQSQDPWLYTSVTSSDYDAINGLVFTSGYDRTVKIWEVASDSSMRMVGEWVHDGIVNIVEATKNGSGLVATASDVAADAVRIYRLDRNNISASPYRSYSCSRVTDEEGNTVSTEKWAYFPATMQWGLAGGSEHLLLVGYSPRNRTGDDSDIPEDRHDSGELCLWDGLTGDRWKLTSARTQNVFEVLWHPSQECFIAATSPLGLDVESGVRTQIRIFTRSDEKEFGANAFSPIKTLDCTALDINELTIMPNSFTFCYVTAGCTDGNVYVWDTAQGDRPIHVLSHGKSVEELGAGREGEDTGVRFTGWGTTLDRFYTGSSDGVVKVWNVRSLGNPLVRNLMEVPAPVSNGMFSPDKTKLLIGDASGKIFLLSVDGEDIQKSCYERFELPGGGFKTIRRPIPIVRHPEPPPPPGYHIETDSPWSRFLQTLQLRLHPNPTIGAVQGPCYADTNLFCVEGHFNRQPAEPLLAKWEAQQQESIKTPAGSLRTRFPPQRPVRGYEALAARHLQNLSLDLDVTALSLETKAELEAAGAVFEPVGGYDFAYEEMATDDIEE